MSLTLPLTALNRSVPLDSLCSSRRVAGLIPQAFVNEACEASQEYFHNKQAHSHISKIQHLCNKVAEVTVFKADMNTKHGTAVILRQHTVSARQGLAAPPLYVCWQGLSTRETALRLPKSVCKACYVAL